MNKRTETGKEIIRKEGITFNLFKSVVTVLLVDPKFDEDFWVWLYESYAGCRASIIESIEDWADEHFSEFTIENQGTELRKQPWIEDRKPPFNIPVLICVPKEDDLITVGMFDISERWVSIDTYRTVKVSKWRKLPR